MYPIDRSLGKDAYQQQLNNIARTQGWTFNKNRENVGFGHESL